jgi:hypothetical protein
MLEEIRSTRRERIDQHKRIEQAFTSGTPWWFDHHSGMVHNSASPD